MKKASLIITFLLSFSIITYAQKKIIYNPQPNEELSRVISLGEEGFLIETLEKSDPADIHRYIMYDWDHNEKWKFETENSITKFNYSTNYFLASPTSNNIFVQYKTDRLNTSFQSTRPKEGDVITYIINKETGKSEKQLLKESHFNVGSSDFGKDFTTIIGDKIVMGGYDNSEKGVLVFQLYVLDPKTGGLTTHKTNIKRELEELKNEQDNSGRMIFVGSTENSLFVTKKQINKQANEVLYVVYELDLEGTVINSFELSAKIEGKFVPVINQFGFYASNLNNIYNHQSDCPKYHKGLSGRIKYNTTDYIPEGNISGYSNGTANYATGSNLPCINSYARTNLKYDSKYKQFYIYGLSNVQGSEKDPNTYFVYRYDSFGNKIAGTQIKTRPYISTRKSAEELISLDLIDSNTAKLNFFNTSMIAMIYTDCASTLFEETVKTPYTKLNVTNIYNNDFSLTKLYSNSKVDNPDAENYYKSVFPKYSDINVECDRYYTSRAVAQQEKKGDVIEITLFK